ncbi:MAG: methionine--tRNA ligase [Sphaerochaetaceae bacterium]|jgi:methionyl-tRNA synthetase|nr:methionine--tRNA ligase [Sphaerochaetaceae bacterium]HHU88917.1 methionine--tRNA ligase [Spirochaetales bacterium]
MKKRLITSALPYVNNIPHLGNLIQVLSADGFARFCRSKGYETLYICGTDEYGTASETKAAQEGITPRELCDKYFVIHRDIYRWFEIDFDHFGRTSTPLQTEIVQAIFKRVDENGYIKEDEIEQLYCEHDQRFLADRYVVGECPKCGSLSARGDQCDECGSLLDPTDLINPKCGICGNTPVLKRTKHLYIDLPKALPLLQEWMDKASVEGFWARNAIQTTKSWIRDGLKERAITRDLKWGIPVPKEGYEDKVFYVWFDAPIGYISITANHTENWRDWWQNSEEVELFQFIGKDNIPFHTVIFPATLLATQEPWTMLHHMSSSEYLNYEGGKFSKSRGMGIFGNDVQDTGIPADMWRFYLFYNRPEKADVLFTWKDFQEKVNGELIGNISNLVHRTLSFIDRFYDGVVPEGEIDETLKGEIANRIEEIDLYFERGELREALRHICYLSSVGNKAFQDGEPWKNRTENPGQSGSLLRTLIYLLRDLGVLLQPFVPRASAQLLAYLNSEGATWQNIGVYSGIEKINRPDYLFRRLEDDLIDTLRERYSGSQAAREKEKSTMDSVAATFAEKVTLRVSRVAEVERHPDGDRLYILQLDTGAEEYTTIVSSIVPFYKEVELLNRNIVLVQNLKPANFRGVKSRGMLLAASDKDDQNHATCEVIFADQFAVGTELLPEGLTAPPQVRSQVKGELFFSLPVYTEGGVVKIEGRPIGTPDGNLTVMRYTDGVVG